MTSIKTKFTLAYSHMLPNHDGQCANLHGHNATVMVSISGLPIDTPKASDEGMVLDFKYVKAYVKATLDSWDHHFLANGDEWPVKVIQLVEHIRNNDLGQDLDTVGQALLDSIPVDVLPRQFVNVGVRTTAELLAQLLYRTVAVGIMGNNDDGDVLPRWLDYVEWYETENNSATYTFEDFCDDEGIGDDEDDGTDSDVPPADYEGTTSDGRPTA